MRNKKSDVYIDDEGNFININGDLIDIKGNLLREPSMDEKSESNISSDLHEFNTISKDDAIEMYAQLEEQVREMDYDDDVKEEILAKAKSFLYNSREILFSLNTLKDSLLEDFDQIRSYGNDLPDVDEQSLLSILTLLFISSKYREEIKRMLDDEML